MTQIRGEQIKDNSIRDRHIASDAAISQSKISGDSSGWIASGIVQIVDTDPAWDGSQSGELFYNQTTDELKLGTTTSPYYELLMGGASGWDTDLDVLMGTEATDSTIEAAQHIGGANLDTVQGYNWLVNPETFGISMDGGAETTVTLNSSVSNSNEAITEINNEFSNAGITSIEAFNDGEGFIGIRKISAVEGESFTLTSGSPEDALHTLGMTAGTYESEKTDGTTFPITSSLELQPAGENVEVYLNGALMENAGGGDYIVDTTAKTITFNYSIYGEDKVTIVVNGSASLTNYATKAYVQNYMTEIKDHLLPDTDATYDIGSSSLRFNNIYAVDGYFSASTIHVGDLGQIKFDTVNNKIQISDDAGNSYADVVKSAPAGEDAIFDAATGQKVVLNSDTAIEVQGDIMPDTGSTRNIGSDAMKFAAIYADEVYVSQSSLYVNGKKVIEDMSDTMTFQTDVDQAVQLKTTSTSAGTGNGNITLTSENLINTTALGGLNFTVGSTVSAKNIQFQNNSTDGNIQFVSNNGTGSGISFTGNATFSDNITINGDLTISGTTTTVNTTTVNIQDNMIQVNSSQTGTPLDTLIGGIEVNRGDEPDYRFVFQESDDTFKIGENGSLQAVATREDFPTVNGLAQWNDTTKRFDTVLASTLSVNYASNAGMLDNLNSTQFLRSDADDATSGSLSVDSLSSTNDITVASRRVVTVASGTSFPTGVGLGDECYRTDLDEWYKYNGSTWIQI